MLLLELYWCSPVEVAVSAVRVETLVFEHRLRQLDTGVPAPPVQEFDLHASPEGLDDGVIVGSPSCPGMEGALLAARLADAREASGRGPRE